MKRALGKDNHHRIHQLVSLKSHFVSNNPDGPAYSSSEQHVEFSITRQESIKPSKTLTKIPRTRSS
jgi:hypothetical protein